MVKLKGKLLYLKDKQFYEEEQGIIQLLGGAPYVEKLKKDYQLLHIIDRDLQRGHLKNRDIYEHLTTEIYVQVEVKPSNVRVAKSLQEIDVRLVLLPPYTGWEELNPDFLAARVEKVEEIPPVKDIVTSSPAVAEVAYDRGHRIFFIGRWQKAFCQIDA